MRCHVCVCVGVLRLCVSCDVLCDLFLCVMFMLCVWYVCACVCHMDVCLSHSAWLCMPLLTYLRAVTQIIHTRSHLCGGPRTVPSAIRRNSAKHSKVE